MFQNLKIFPNTKNVRKTVFLIEILENAREF